MKGENRCKDKP